MNIDLRKQNELFAILIGVFSEQATAIRDFQ